MSPKLAIAVKSLQSCSAIVHFVAASSLASSMDSGTYALPESRSNIVKASSLSIGGAEACDLFVKRSQIENRRESQTRVASSLNIKEEEEGSPCRSQCNSKKEATPPPRICIPRKGGGDCGE